MANEKLVFQFELPSRLLPSAKSKVSKSCDFRDMPRKNCMNPRVKKVEMCAQILYPELADIYPEFANTYPELADICPQVPDREYIAAFGGLCPHVRGFSCGCYLCTFTSVLCIYSVKFLHTWHKSVTFAAFYLQKHLKHDKETFGFSHPDGSNLSPRFGRWTAHEHESERRFPAQLCPGRHHHPDQHLRQSCRNGLPEQRMAPEHQLADGLPDA